MKKISRLFAIAIVFLMLISCNVACGEGGIFASKPATKMGLSVNTMPTKTTYYVGERFFPKGLTLTLTWSDGKTEQIGYEQCDYPKDIFMEAVDKVTVKYEGLSVDVPITVQALLVERIDILNERFVSAIKVTEKFKIGNINVNAIYNDGSSVKLENYTVKMDGQDVTETVKGEGISLTKGLHRCDITVAEKTYTYYVGAYDDTAEEVKVEAENITHTSDLTGEEKNFLEVVNLAAERKYDGAFKVESTERYGASGTGSIGNIQKGDIFKLHATVLQAGKYTFYANLASCSRSTKTSVASNTVNDLFKMKINGVEFAIPDSVVAHGHSTDKWTTQDWFYWTFVCFGEVELKEGENVIEIECYNTNQLMTNSGDCINFDYFAFQK